MKNGNPGPFFPASIPPGFPEELPSPLVPHSSPGGWARGQGEWIPADHFYLTPSCILGAINPATERIIGRLYDLLGLHWSNAGDGRSQCTCCSGILSHGDVITFESTLLTVARIWSVAREQGFKNISTACVTSFAIHNECLEMLHEEPGLAEKVDRWLREACGRRLEIPDVVVHASDVIYRHRTELRQKMAYKLQEKTTGRPLRLVEHVGCHYNKVFPQKSAGGLDHCDVLAGVIREWGGEVVDYPERRHCCGMGFRQCMMRPNRGYTFACVERKLTSMAPENPAAILANCPGCIVFLDKGQWAVNRITGSNHEIPVLSYAEMAALLLGWDPYDVVGIQAHTTPVESLLVRLGIPFEERRAWEFKEAV